MKPLGPPDLHSVRAAEGWFELGNVSEAEQELARIAPASQQHPQVLSLRWQLRARAGDWAGSLALAQTLVGLDPDAPQGWIHRSYALHELRQTEAAYVSLLPAAERFPAEPIIAYNLACYTCRLGRPDDTWHWLRRAIAVGGRDLIKTMALQDKDLEPLWPKIAEL